MNPALDFDVTAVLKARATLRPHLPPTPLRLSRCTGRSDVFLKLEAWQPTGSFKVRGALNLIASLEPEQRARGLVTASAGNHALGVAHAVDRLGLAVPATVFVPRGAPQSKLDRLRGYPVTLELAGDTFDEAQALAFEHVRRTGATFVHGYDDPRTAAGQGTIGLEIVEERPEIATLIVPVGGGGLISGIAVAAKAVSPRVRIVAVQPDASPALRESFRSGRPLLEYAAAPTLADGLAGGIGEIVFGKRNLIDDVAVVSEEAIERAIVALLLEDHVVAEGSAAVGIAALLDGALRADGPIAVVITGSNIDGSVLRRLVERHA